MTLGVACSLLFASCSKDNDRKDSPNIIIINADDMGYGDLGAYGHPSVATPHIDRMANEGLKFNSFYTASAVCSPSRGGLMTGRLPVKTGLYGDRRVVLFPQSVKGMPKEEQTIAELLNEQGYSTALVGKWHLGHLKEYMPNQHGFDYFYGLPYSNDMCTGWGRKKPKGYPDLPFYENEKLLEVEPAQDVLTKRYTEKSLEFIRSNSEKPFFLYLAYAMPHVPITASADFAGRSLNGEYGDTIEEIDWSVGQILNELRKSGLDKNTLVFFTSDNGPAVYWNLQGGFSGHLRNGKGTTWEGGMRVPGIAWMPGTVKPGVFRGIASQMDLIATAADMTASKDKVRNPLDGRSLLPAFNAEVDQIHKNFFYYQGSELSAVRKGPWKMYLTTYGDRFGKYPKKNHEESPMLFNVDVDPTERFDMAEKHPEIVEDLKGLAEKQKKETVVKKSLFDTF
ncbi:arylsulfatase (plasmid) [Fulvitalea axinellae]|uniref:Arylsulfatase n=2 Tax=Fulvitalea axinellae TaxID=1182444 RepID=A0AAU9DNK3_9BACT|nr:arylsulfatase [Fulvitalea axinellae]